MQKTKKDQAIKKLQSELKDEKQAEITARRETIIQRRKATEERKRLEENKAKVRLALYTASNLHSSRRFRWQGRPQG
jgi:hypothetical protein